MSFSNPSSQQEPAGRNDGREVEWQFACDDLEAARRWLYQHQQVDGWALDPGETLELLDVYFDTEDWRIFRAGFALRLRSVSGRCEATLKSLRSSSAEYADRRELREPLDSPTGDWVQALRGPVGKRVLAVSGSSSLRPLFEVRTARRRFVVRRSGESEAQGEIALDESVLSPPEGEPTARLRRVELEAFTADLGPLRRLAGTLREACALETPGDNKFSLGLRSVGLAPVMAPPFAPATVSPGMTMVEVALANLRRQVTAWHLHEPGARLGDEPEELHVLRVAVRRVDALVRDFHDFLATPPTLRGALKQVLRALGEARDLDVALDGLAAFSRDLEPEERRAVEPLQRLLSAERDRARAAMIQVLDSASVRQELQGLDRWLLAPPAPGTGFARREAASLLRRRYRKVRRAAERLHRDASVEARHALRGQVKKLRYILEALAELYGKPAERMLRALRRWQEQLGVQQDAAVAAHRLQLLAASPPDGFPPPTLFLMGRLAEHQDAVAARARGSQGKDRRRLRRRWRRLRASWDEG